MAHKRSMLRLEIIVGIVVSFWEVARATDCPDGWLAFQGSCYLNSRDSLQFVEAERFCEHHGSHLVHINDQTESQFISNFLAELKDIYHWIGLNDYEIDGVWRWTDTDTIATFTNWHTGEPNGHTRENCAIIYPVFNYKWIDENCLARHKPLCEKETRFDTGVVG